jgi:hypothetical protein
MDCGEEGSGCDQVMIWVGDSIDGSASSQASG